MILSGTCACGRRADSFGGLCDRCVALQTLGLVSSAPVEHIENTYRTLVQVWHPDRFLTDPRLQLPAVGRSPLHCGKNRLNLLSAKQPHSFQLRMPVSRKR